MPEIFPGFDQPDRNWSKLPHSFIETLPITNNLAEVKVVLYVLRHTWGFQEYETGKRITLDEFMHGRKQADGSRMDGGTGLCLNSVKAGVRRAVERGFLVQEPDGRQDSGRASHVYSLRRAPAEVSEPDGRVSESDSRLSESDSRLSESDSRLSESDSSISRVEPLGVKARQSGYQTLTPRLSEIDTRSEKETKERKTRKTGPEVVPKRVTCSIHRTMMKKRSNEDGEIWYSHKIGADEWCQGATGDQPELPPKPVDNRQRYISGEYRELLQY